MASAGNTFAAAPASRPSATNGFTPCPANVNSTRPGHPMQPSMAHCSAGLKDSTYLQHTEQANESNSVHPTQGVEIDDDGFSQVRNLRVERSNQRRINPIIVGTKKSDQYHGCQPRASLFIARVSKEYPYQYMYVTR